MLIITSTLDFNGITTFVLRLSRQFSKTNKIAVLVLVDNVNPQLKEKIESYCDIYYLKDFLRPLFKWAYSTQLGVFLPNNTEQLLNLISKYGSHCHVTGAFSLLFISRLKNKSNIDFKTSVGIYHQNEFMFKPFGYYFSNESQRIFSNLNPRSIVFFNEANKESYSSFFKCDYKSSSIVPIGIDLPKLPNKINGSSDSLRIVSIGNLFNFKTYNLHIINCLPSLLKINPRFSYDIYGTGPFENELRKKVKILGLGKSVHFKGRVDYEKLPEALKDTFLFVGSGTAILEAAALGIPSLIGIESTSKPITYGFLSDVPGFSYNEFDQNFPVFEITDKIISLIDTPSTWDRIANECLSKAETFEITHTVEGFKALESKDINLAKDNSVSSFRLLISFIWAGLLHQLKLDAKFADRRDQSSMNQQKLK